MASVTAYDAVLARLEAGWDAASRGPITGENEGGSVPSHRSPFLTLEFPVSTSEQLSVGSPGSNLFRESGAFRLILSVPRGAGRKPFDGWAEDLRVLFRNHVEGTLTCWEPSPPSYDGLNDNESYFEISVACPYQFDFYA